MAKRKNIKRNVRIVTGAVGRPRSAVAAPLPSGAILQRYREAAGLTIAQMVAASDCSRSGYYDHELGRKAPALRTLRAYDAAVKADGRLVQEVISCMEG